MQLAELMHTGNTQSRELETTSEHILRGERNAKYFYTLFLAFFLKGRLLAWKRREAFKIKVQTSKEGIHFSSCALTLHVQRKDR